MARNRFASVAEEMGIVLRRTGYSPNIKERADCSAAVFVADGEMLAQAEHIPVHLGSMPASVKAVLDVFGTDVPPDAQFAVNDPFHGGTHLNDLTIVAPIFAEGRLVGWVANRAHHADVGGEAPGSMPAHATTVDQEGCRVAPMMAWRHGDWLTAFSDPFLEATRTPDERLGDLSAQVGANAAGARRYAELIADAGVAAFEATAHALLDYGERRMRAALTALPDGSHEFEDVMEFGDADLPIRVRITVDGDGLSADFAGTHAQIPGNINAVEAVTRSCLYYAVRVATDPTIPANGGCYRPLHLSAPAGSLVAAEAPVAVAAGNVETSQRIA
ncbi:MAG: hydantoinase B/oxoprolinase family protein, partial [Actinobacteria bacterium]|nr:hydantoinase B/oxoprolinase family protein [Actinomycetota bacterium]NIW33043.1 hydantoinase B/oxoprolinase family protein [Actinomycetota bacterium]